MRTPCVRGAPRICDTRVIREIVHHTAVSSKLSPKIQNNLPRKFVSGWERPEEMGVPSITTLKAIRQRDLTSSTHTQRSVVDAPHLKFFLSGRRAPSSSACHPTWHANGAAIILELERRTEAQCSMFSPNH